MKENPAKFINENQNLAIDCGRSKLLIENYVFTDSYFAQDRPRNFHSFTVCQ